MDDSLLLQKLHLDLARLSRVARFLIYDDAHFPDYLLSVLGDPDHAFTRPAGSSNASGFCHLRIVDEGLFLNNIYLAPEYRRRGAGRKLLHDTILLLKTARHVSVELDVHESNMRALAWYRRLGFEEVDRTTWLFLGTPLAPESQPGICLRSDDNRFSQIYSHDLHIGTRIGRRAILNGTDFAERLGARDFDEVAARVPAREMSPRGVVLETSIRLRADVEQVLEELAR
ncbi:GNAT family N-acetyltransferase [Cryobacterium suzukii]|nr:GNAT family N-acetyltransferase [Cryobacterium suzukii]